MNSLDCKAQNRLQPTQVST